MHEHVMQAGLGVVETGQGDALLETALQQHLWIGVFLDLDFPQAIAISAGGVCVGVFNGADHPRGRQQRRNVACAFQNDAPGNDGVHVVERAVEDLASFGDQQHAVTQTLGVLHDVGGKNHRLAGAGHVADQLLQHFLIHWVEAREGLVENDQLGPVRHSGEHLHLLAHALGE